jgi:hypothetical protein
MYNSQNINFYSALPEQQNHICKVTIFEKVKNS